MNLQNERLSSTKLVIDDKNAFNAIGADVVLTDCAIESSVPASALSIRATITGGEFTTKQLLDGFYWCEARLEKVRFSGRFRNNRFGHLPEYGAKGAVQACDFSLAVLSDCEFYDCKVDSLIFPAWPHLTALHPKRLLSDIESQGVSQKLRCFFEFLEHLDDDCDAIVRNVETLTLSNAFPYDELRGLAAQLQNLRC